jgi:hypothetical protein
MSIIAATKYMNNFADNFTNHLITKYTKSYFQDNFNTFLIFLRVYITNHLNLIEFCTNTIGIIIFLLRDDYLMALFLTVLIIISLHNHNYNYNRDKNYKSGIDYNSSNSNYNRNLDESDDDNNVNNDNVNNDTNHVITIVKNIHKWMYRLLYLSLFLMNQFTFSYDSIGLILFMVMAFVTCVLYCNCNRNRDNYDNNINNNINNLMKISNCLHSCILIYIPLFSPIHNHSSHEVITVYNIVLSSIFSNVKNINNDDDIIIGKTNGQDAYWYISPTQTLFELYIMHNIFYYIYKKYSDKIIAYIIHDIASIKTYILPYTNVPIIINISRVLVTGLISAIIIHKIYLGEIIYLLQPCHIITALLTIAIWIPENAIGKICWHFVYNSVCMLVFAILFPDMRGRDIYGIILFWIQHLGIIANIIVIARTNVFKQLEKYNNHNNHNNHNTIGIIGAIWEAYHWYILLPVGILFGKSLNYTINPLPIIHKIIAPHMIAMSRIIFQIVGTISWVAINHVIHPIMHKLIMHKNNIIMR